jgi:beta-galactosidase
MRKPTLRIALAALACIACTTRVIAEPRIVIGLHDGWRFKQGAVVGEAQAASFDDSQWTQVRVPHTWNRIGNDGLTRSPESNSYRGISWYHLRLPTPAAARGKRAFLQFDGVGAIADVWVNGTHVGTHKGAFSRFRFDVTAALKAQGDNLVAVKADNSKPEPGSSTEHVIPLSGDFFIFGGLYREVSLILTDPVHVDLLDAGGPGVYARALRIDPRQAVISVRTTVLNEAATKRDVRVEVRIEDAQGKLVTANAKPVSIPAHSAQEREAVVTVDVPRRWQGVADPYLYRVALAVRSPKGELLDEVRQPLGLRTMSFDPDKGFFLNGEHLMLVGASMHQDRPVKGWALTPADRVQDFDLFQEMGGNAIRFAHYQHDQTAYDLADARGIVAWAEIPLVNEVSFDGSPPSAELAANAQQQLKELIRQNYNHPSIAVWSVGNEIDLLPTSTNKPARAGALVSTLNELAKAEDPGRFTTHADCCEQTPSSPDAMKPRDVLVGRTDTQGYNRYFGWYSGKLADLGPYLDAAHARRPQLPLSVSEYGAGSAVTQHTDNALGGPFNSHGRPHPEEVQLRYHEESWRQLRERSYLWGAFIWNMFDFASDSRNEGDVTDVNEKGMVSYNRAVKKDVFYFYKANWSRAPSVHLVGRRYVDRAYSVVDVKAYSNAGQARLSVNGIGVGATPCEGGICIWPRVHLQSGNNQVVATAQVAGTTVTDSLQWIYSGSLCAMRIKAGDLSGYVGPDGARYGSDNFFEGGEGRGINAPDAPEDRRSRVTGTDAPALYDSYRAGNFAYNLPLPQGDYKATVRLVEPAESSAGKRVFDIAVNGRVVLAGVDPFALAQGPLKAVDRSFTARSDGGLMRLEFRPRQGEGAIVSALEITASDPSCRSNPWDPLPALPSSPR